MGIKPAVCLLLTGVACQLVVNVDDYRFERSDASAEIATLEPPANSGGSGAPPDDAIGDAAAPPAPIDPDLGAGGGDTSSAAPGDTPDGGQSETSPNPPEPEPEPSDPEPETSQPEPLPPHPQYGCSLIEFCYAYEVEDTTDEERCIQSGCSLEDANAECRREIAEECGIAPLPPFVMVTLTGERVILN